METLTIQVTETALLVKDGKLPRAKLKYYAPGLEIYLIGAVTISRRAAVNQIAFDLCLARHIPLISLKALGWVK